MYTAYYTYIQYMTHWSYARSFLLYWGLNYDFALCTFLWCSSLKEKNFVWSRNTLSWPPHSKISSAASRPQRRVFLVARPSKASQIRYSKLLLGEYKRPKSVSFPQSYGSCNKIFTAFISSYPNLWPPNPTCYIDLRWPVLFNNNIKVILNQAEMHYSNSKPQMRNLC